MNKKIFTAAEQSKLLKIYLDHGYVRKYYFGFGCKPETCIKHLREIHRHKRKLEELEG